MDSLANVEEVLSSLVKAIVDVPTRVRVMQHEHEGALTLSISVAQVDRPKLMGENGRTIKSLRVIAGAILRDHRPLFLHIE